MASLLNSRVEHTVIINDITQENNKLVEDKSNKTAKFHRLYRSMEEAVYTHQSVVEEEERNCGPQKKCPPTENENSDRISNS